MRTFAVALVASVALVVAPLTAAEPALAAKPSPVVLSTLQVEKKTEPIGIDLERPRFSWVVESEQRDTVQQSFRLRVATTASAFASGRGIVWDSGVVASAESSNVEYTGPRLESASRFLWQVDVVTNAGTSSAGSEFRTGLASESDWAGSEWIGNERAQQSGAIDLTLAGASWIHPPYAGANTPPGYFRKSFALDDSKQIAAAEFTMTGDIGFSAFLNGVQIASGASVADRWKSAARVAVQPLAAGNLLAVRLNNTAKTYGAIVGKLTVLYTDGTTQDVVTDASWLSSRTAETGWHVNGYDTSAWTPAAARAVYGGAPWGAQVVVPATPTPDTRMNFDTASWILPPIGEPSSGNPIPSTLFRRTVEASTSKEIAWAQLAVTGDQVFTAYWNGEQVAANTGANNEWQSARAVALDAAPGENTLAIALETPGTSGFGGVLARVRIGYTDGSSSEIATTSAFKTLVSPNASAPAGWTDNGFDDTGWANAQAQALYRGWVYGDRVTIPEITVGTAPLTLAGSSWIWTPEATTPVAPGEERAFRRTIEAPEGRTLESAEVLITADDSFRLFVDGALVGETEGAVNEWQQSHLYDVDLDEDRSVFAVRTMNGAGSPAGLVAAIRVRYDNGTTAIVRTGPSWLGSKAVPSDFAAPDFDDSAWGAAVVQAAYGAGPWGTGVRPPVDQPLAAPLLRKEFDLTDGVKAATLYVAAGGYADVSINGEPVSDDVLSPGFTDYDDTVQYVATDVTELVRDGRNAIGVELGRGFYGMTGGNVWRWNSPPWHDEPVVRAVLRMEYANGRVQDVVTDKSWRIHAGPTIFDDLYGGETYGAALVQTGFDTVGFEAGDWSNAAEVFGPKGVLVNQRQQPIRVTEELPAIEITEPVDNTYVVKFPRVIAGWVEFTATGAAGTTIRAQYGEKLRANGLPNFDNNGGFGSGFQTDRFVLAGTGEPETWEPKFSYKGFQYIQVTGWPGDEPPSLEDFTAKVVHTDAAEWGSFESSEPIMNEVHRAVVDTLKNNIHGIPTDTPMFEKNGWTGDAAVGAEMFMMNLDTHELFAKWMRDLHETRDAEGAPMVIAPSSGSWGEWGVAPPWHSAYVMIPWWLYQYGNDDRVLTEQYEGMKAYVDLEYGRSSGGIVSNPRLGDWVSPEASPAGGNAPEDVRVSGTAYLYAMLTQMEQIAAYLGKADDAATLAANAAVVKGAFNAAFLDTGRGLYRGNGNDRGYRQTHNVLALAFGLAPDEATAARVATSIVADIEARGGTLNTGVLGTKYLLPVLSEYGHSDVAFELAVQTAYPSWGYIVENGGTTMWEHWSKEARSLGHYFLGTVDDWLYHGVAGIAPSTSVGYREITIKPEVTQRMDWAKGSTQTPFGPVSVDWRTEAGVLTLNTHVPVGSTARVHLPAANAWAVTEGAKSLDAVKGVRSVEDAGETVVVTVGSGDYSFEVDPSAGAIGSLHASIDELEARVTASHAGGMLTDGERDGILQHSADARRAVDAGLTAIRTDGRTAAAQALVGGLSAVDGVDEQIAAVQDAGAAATLAEASAALRSAFGSTVSDLLDIEITAEPDAEGYLPGATGEVVVTLANGGDAAVTDVTAGLAGLPDDWTVGAASVDVADRIEGGTSASGGLEFTVGAAAPPADVPAAVGLDYRFGGERVSLSAATEVRVESPISVEAVELDRATAAPDSVVTLTATVANAGAEPVEGILRLTAPGGWQAAAPSVVVPPGGRVDVPLSVQVPVATPELRHTVELGVAFVRAEAELATGTAELQVVLEPVAAVPPGFDRVDLGVAAAEQAHGLTSSPSSGTSSEAGLTRRYAGHLVDFSWFEFDAAVVAGQPFALRAIETYDRAQTKRYKVYVDGVEVALRQFTHSGGAGTETYQLLVPAELATSDRVRIRFETQDDHSFYDPSIADVWTLPVGP